MVTRPLVIPFCPICMQWFDPYHIHAVRCVQWYSLVFYTKVATRAVICLRTVICSQSSVCSNDFISFVPHQDLSQVVTCLFNLVPFGTSFLLVISVLLLLELTLGSQDHYACVHCIMLLLSPRSRDYWARSSFSFSILCFSCLSGVRFFKHLLFSCSVKCFCWFSVNIIKHIDFGLNYASLASQESGLLSTFLVFLFQGVILDSRKSRLLCMRPLYYALLSPWSWDY